MFSDITAEMRKGLEERMTNKALEIEADEAIDAEVEEVEDPKVRIVLENTRDELVS